MAPRQARLAKCWMDVWPGGTISSGVFVTQLVERKVTLLDDVERAANGPRMIGEEAVHLIRRLQVSLGVWKEPEAGVVNGAAVADAGQDILEDAPAGVVVMHVIGGEERDREGAGDVEQARQARLVVAAVEAGDRQ